MRRRLASCAANFGDALSQLAVVPTGYVVVLNREMPVPAGWKACDGIDGRFDLPQEVDAVDRDGNRILGRYIQKVNN